MLCSDSSAKPSVLLAVNKARMLAHAQALSKLNLKTAPLLAIVNALEDGSYAICDPARSPCIIVWLACLTCVIVQCVEHTSRL